MNESCYVAFALPSEEYCRAVQIMPVHCDIYMQPLFTSLGRFCSIHNSRALIHIPCCNIILSFSCNCERGLIFSSQERQSIIYKALCCL